MKTISPTLQALFSAAIPFEQFDLYTFTLRSGLVLRYANCPFDIVTGGNTFLCSRSSGGIAIDEEGDSGPRAHWTSNLSVGTWSINIMPRDGDVIGDLPWLPAVQSGIMDEATLQVDRGYVSAWPDPPRAQLVPALGVIDKIFYGRVAEIDFGRSMVTVQANDPLELLAVDMPRNVYSSSCRFALFGPGCNLASAPFEVDVVVNGVVDNQTINTTAIQADDYFALGEALWTSGRNAGLRSSIRSYAQSGGTIELIAPMPFTVMNGDAVTLLPGCDKSRDTCLNKFSNLDNFGGFPFIPAPETAI